MNENVVQYTLLNELRKLVQLMGYSVMVAQGTLTPYVCVQLTVSQPNIAEW